MSTPSLPLSKLSLLRGVALSGLITALACGASLSAQVTVDAEQTTSVNTADDGDITIATTGSIVTTDSPAVTLNSDNDVSVAGSVTIADTDDATAVSIESGNTGNFDLAGALSVNEDYTPTDTDSDFINDGPVAIGTGRTGILISGGSAFTGNVTSQTGSSIFVEGNDSAGLRLAGDTSLDGDLDMNSQVQVAGANSFGYDIAGDVSGNVDIAGSVRTNGENVRAVDITGDVGDRVTVSSSLASSGYRFTTRQNSFVRERLDDEDNLQGGNTLRIAGNVDGGIYLSNVYTDDGDDDNDLPDFAGLTSITHAGSEAAVLIGSDGTPIIVGLVADVTDPNADFYDSTLEYSLVNEAQISANGVFDDVTANAMRIQNAQLTNGFSNESIIASQTYRSGIAGDADDVAGDVAHSRALIFASGSDVPNLDNLGTITAVASEAADTIFADETNIEGANDVNATAIQIDSGAVLSELTNTGTISAILSGRQGTAYALVDQSGSLAVINNEGVIRASATSSDTNGVSENLTPSFTLVALDLTANTTGVTLNNVRAVDTDTTDTVTPATPIISGDVRFGSGDDTFNSDNALMVGTVTFGDGADTLNLTNSILTGSITDSDGRLTLNSTGSAITLLSADALDVTSATFDAESTFLPLIDGRVNRASTLNASGAVTFADGAVITPLLANVIGNGGTFTLVDADTLTLGTAYDDFVVESAPWLYDTRLNSDAQTVTATLTLRTTEQLGLDAQQSAAFAGTFDALSNDDSLGAAFASITDEQSFNAAYNQLLPEFAAAASQFVSSNVDGSTGAVATHLNTARRSEDKPGGAWIQEFAYFADRELSGLSEQYRGFGFGFTGGFDSQIGPIDMVGINFGFAATEVEDVLGFDDPLNVQSLQAGLYAAHSIGQLGFDAYVGGGVSAFEQARNIEIGTYTAFAESEWTGVHYNASFNAGYDIAVGKYFMRPSANISYMSLAEQSRIEDGDQAIRLAYQDRTSEIGTATALLDFGGRFEGDRIWWSPSARIGIRNQFAGDGIVTDAFFANSGIPLSLQSNEFPATAAIFGVSFAAGSKYSSFGIDYDADIRDGFNRHTLRLVLRMLF